MQPFVQPPSPQLFLVLFVLNQSTFRLKGRRSLSGGVGRRSLSGGVCQEEFVNNLNFIDCCLFQLYSSSVPVVAGSCTLYLMFYIVISVNEAGKLSRAIALHFKIDYIKQKIVKKSNHDAWTQQEKGCRCSGNAQPPVMGTWERGLITVSYGFFI